MFLSVSACRGLAGMAEKTNVRGPRWRACSACAGDYEDPESTARAEQDTFETGDEDGEENQAGGHAGGAGGRGFQIVKELKGGEQER